MYVVGLNAEYYLSDHEAIQRLKSYVWWFVMFLRIGSVREHFTDASYPFVFVRKSIWSKQKKISLEKRKKIVESYINLRHGIQYSFAGDKSYGGHLWHKSHFLSLTPFFSASLEDLETA